MQELFHASFVLNPIPLLTCANSVIKMVLLRLSEADLFTFCTLKIDHELLNWVILGHHFDGTLECLALILQLVPANGFLDERDVGGEVTVELHCNLTEGSNDLLHEILVWVLHVIKQFQKLVDDLG